MVLLAKRVSASAPRPTIASTSGAPSERAAAWMRSNMRSSSLCFSAAITGSNFHVAKTRGTGAMAGAHDLLGLALAAVGNAPEHPVIAVGNGRAGVPELRADAAVGGILEHADALAVAYFPGDFGAELKVVAFVVNGPALVGVHVNGVAGLAEKFFECFLARKQTDIGHANEREVRPTIGAHGAVGMRISHGRRRLARGHIAAKDAVANDVDALGHHALVVKGERPQPRTMLLACVTYHVDDVGAVA